MFSIILFIRKIQKHNWDSTNSYISQQGRQHTLVTTILLNLMFPNNKIAKG